MAPAREFNAEIGALIDRDCHQTSFLSSRISTSNSNHACIEALYSVAVSTVGKRPTDPGRSLNRTLALGPFSWLFLSTLESNHAKPHAEPFLWLGLDPVVADTVGRRRMTAAVPRQRQGPAGRRTMGEHPLAASADSTRLASPKAENR